MYVCNRMLNVITSDRNAQKRPLNDQWLTVHNFELLLNVK